MEPPATLGEVTIRPATATDRAVALALWQGLERDQSPHRVFPVVADARERFAAEFDAALHAEDGRFLVAERNGAVVGMAHLHLERPSRMSDEVVVEMGRVVVQEGHRGRGVGAALVEAAEAFARERGASGIAARVFAGNEAALGFWRERGFAPGVAFLIRRL